MRRIVRARMPRSGGHPKRQKNGGAEGNRTPDLYNAIVALSQLSYGPEPWEELAG